MFLSSYGEKQMVDRSLLSFVRLLDLRTRCLMSTALLAFGLCVCSAMMYPAASQPVPPPQKEEEEEYGEFAARPTELASVAVNDIVRSLRLNRTAMELGRTVYDKSCASCHGTNLKGVPE